MVVLPVLLHVQRDRVKGIVLKKRSYTILTVLLVALCFSESAGAMTTPDQSKTVKHHHVTKPKRLAAPTGAPMLYVGASENQILSDDQDKSFKVALLAQAMGENLVRINIKFHVSDPLEANENVDPSLYLPTTSELNELCNAAKSLVGVGIRNLMLTFLPTDNRGYPQSQSALNQLNKIIDTYLAELYGPTGCADTNGQPALSLLVQAGNEMNIETFCQPQNDGDHLFCAQVAAIMQASVYTFIKSIEVTTYGVPITVVGASVASHHTPWLYLSQYQHKMAVLTHCVCMDVFDFHPYAQWGSCDQMSGFKMYKTLLANGRRTFGKGFATNALPFGYFEWAVQTQESNAEGYQGDEQPNCLVVPETQTVPIWADAIGYSEQQHSMAFVSEHVCDEQYLATGFQSALVNYTCDRRKPGFTAISKLLQAAHVQ